MVLKISVQFSFKIYTCLFSQSVFISSSHATGNLASLQCTQSSGQIIASGNIWLQDVDNYVIGHETVVYTACGQFLKHLRSHSLYCYRLNISVKS